MNIPSAEVLAGYASVPLTYGPLTSVEGTGWFVEAKRTEDLLVGDVVIGHAGTTRTVTNVDYHPNTGDTYLTTETTTSCEIYSTTEHCRPGSRFATLTTQGA
jgi:hypothetical protein